MRVRLYLKADPQLEKVVKLRRRSNPRSIEGKLAAGLKLGWDNEGPHLEFSHPLFGTPYAAVELLNLKVRSVEILEIFPTYASGHPRFTVPSGIYELDEVIGSVGQRPEDGAMQLRVVGDNLFVAEDLFNRIRSGEIKPTSPWLDAPQAESADAELTPPQ